MRLDSSTEKLEGAKQGLGIQSLCIDIAVLSEEKVKNKTAFQPLVQLTTTTLYISLFLDKF